MIVPSFNTYLNYKP